MCKEIQTFGFQHTEPFFCGTGILVVLGSKLAIFGIIAPLLA